LGGAGCRTRRCRVTEIAHMGRGRMPHPSTERRRLLPLPRPTERAAVARRTTRRLTCRRSSDWRASRWPPRPRNGGGRPGHKARAIDGADFATQRGRVQRPIPEPGHALARVPSYFQRATRARRRRRR
jgi:hypothetical protein